MIKVNQPEKSYHDRVSVIIPAYNEADIIGTTLRNLDFDWIKEIIVINDGSDDNTLEKIIRFPVKIINFKENRGKGKAVEQGCQLAKGKIIALIDADLGQSVKNIEKLVLPVLKGKADVTIADIPIKEGGLGLVRMLAEKGLYLISGKKFKSPLSGQRVLKRELIKDILPFSERFGLEIGMNIDFVKNNWQVKEIKCELEHQTTGHSFKGYWHRSKQFIDILLTFWQKRRI